LVLLLIPIIIFELVFCSFQFLHVVPGSLHVYSVYQFDILSIGTHVGLACNGVLCREITLKFEKPPCISLGCKVVPVQYWK